MITRGKTRNMDAVLKTLNEIKEDLKGKATQEQINNLLVEIQSLHLMGSQNLRAVKIYLDLTKRRYDIRKHAVEKVKNNPKIDLPLA